MTAPALDDWLAGKIAGYLSITADQVDRDRSLADYGLDSVYALTLCGEIEDEFGLTVEPTLAWDYPTVDAMSGHLDSLLRAKA
ncbi:Phosphopantetheine attachment site domain protein [Mycobacteroides abscessus subsp. abscessus]|uniref:Phosphopantetheine attachment site domain protein n=8 Tax=Mycobacteroides abscessus TaxID=36809 RepID=B1MF45_MYCA9|nr:acyl carrier protein [Mycobacteroides abscessus]ETZ90667.1 phosphopantetheine attachment site family protein [Mycobacteroides abscessus MAB_030201_1075]ETZ92026.1 phosphopantetheine attachment site family protein [Mycobacteroides abscessus MAB_030201_1061]EUA46163.1 phosphopantetheine attachment site family protein [Mycobacteroides abscessus 21]EUA62247.1 phosphopantetheine attachment site family protein [Mycobacteroides abscessus 1948]ALM17754.1 polyketide synthase [Mycobacteroides abscess